LPPNAITAEFAALMEAGAHHAGLARYVHDAIVGVA
jgi:hypothetical protein